MNLVVNFQIWPINFKKVPNVIKILKPISAFYIITDRQTDTVKAAFTGQEFTDSYMYLEMPEIL
jgi:hypothetical protein